ncbi:MAG: putative amidase [Burkholderiaceae bacterium]|jgi:amidase/aspartyl-tRNA(Asn)/glutamyl-tRNA(Gln) amidotransferase subunit A|nr:MAG: putative amidase [Burkholderiaceae bacterium]
MPDDLHRTRRRIASNQTAAVFELEKSIAAAGAPNAAQAFTRTMFDEARAVVRDPDLARRPLAGLGVSVKDLFDIAGQPTPAGSTVLADAPPAAADCTAVARLKAAGGVVIGRSNMTEFAYSGVGVNPHYGTPAAWDGRHDQPPGGTAAPPRIPGGSSSGAAVSVAIGAAFVGLGSDTGGSIRIPAALNGIVGFKNTARLVPTAGALPLSTTLDTACAMTRSVRDAITVHQILVARTVVHSSAPLAAYRLAVADTLMQDALEPTVAQAFERTLSRLAAAGARIERIALTDLADTAALFAGGGFSAVESYAWHRKLLEQRAADYDPRVLTRIERGATIAGYEYVDLLQQRARWIAAMEAALQGFDAVLSPTVPIAAPPIASVAPAQGLDAAQDALRDAEFFRVNALLLRNTSVVNMLDGCAVSIPCHRPDELPIGLMIWHAALHDDMVLAIAQQAERILSNQ